MKKTPAKDYGMRLAAAFPGFVGLAPAVQATRKEHGVKATHTEFVWLATESGVAHALVDLNTETVLTSTEGSWGDCWHLGERERVYGYFLILPGDSSYGRRSVITQYRDHCVACGVNLEPHERWSVNYPKSEDQ